MTRILRKARQKKGTLIFILTNIEFSFIGCRTVSVTGSSVKLCKKKKSWSVSKNLAYTQLSVLSNCDSLHNNVLRFVEILAQVRFIRENQFKYKRGAMSIYIYLYHILKLEGQLGNGYMLDLTQLLYKQTLILQIISVVPFDSRNPLADSCRDPQSSMSCLKWHLLLQDCIKHLNRPSILDRCYLNCPLLALAW